ncbi:hypothetical protein B0H66DRAFT_609061 [Apodospora peruviana]|uniref:MYND-type domain-containing protein n=1 Tax=Apodospora peruviana TaxID=516989 RepID=A0AAE0HRZ4_9PEZI|nr:hypothetical protein B0H66DRAFT_609061 [Apodospora peruviana]
MAPGAGLEDSFPHMFPKQCEFYCKRTHQWQDWSTHKSTCNTIKKAREEVDKIERKLRGNTPNPFDDQRNFWDQIPTRLYLKARFLHAEMLIRSWRRQGIEDALAIYLDILRLDRGDHQGARNLIPALFLHLGRDQEMSYDYSDYTLPYLDIKNADATEPEDLWKEPQMLNLPMLASVFLLKMRLFRSLQLVHRSRNFHPKRTDPQDILAAIRDDCKGDILERRLDIVGADYATLTAHADRVGAQLADMLSSAELSSGPQAYTAGSVEEARLAFMYTYNAWCESPLRCSSCVVRVAVAMQQLRGVVIGGMSQGDMDRIINSMSPEDMENARRLAEID